MIKLGQTARDKITGFTGKIVAETEWLNGCLRYTLQPQVDNDGKFLQPETFDEPQVEVIDDGINFKEKKSKCNIRLGDKVKDNITGFLGTAMARTIWISGNNRITIQPSVDAKGKHQEGHSFDEGGVVAVGETIPQSERKVGTGGPIPTPREY